LPLAVESLRAMRQAPSLDERVTISAADPLNLVGIIVPGDRVPANSGASVTYQDGVAVAEPHTPAVIRLSLAR
jgi:ATP-dependent Lhr-like helicase